MNQVRRIKPVSYLKSNTAEIVRSLAEHGEPLIITQNGKAKAVLQDIDSFEKMQETLILLKVLALGNKQVADGKIIPASDAIRHLRSRRKDVL